MSHPRRLLDRLLDRLRRPGRACFASEAEIPSGAYVTLPRSVLASVGATTQPRAARQRVAGVLGSHRSTRPFPLPELGTPLSLSSPSPSVSTLSIPSLVRIDGLGLLALAGFLLAVVLA